LYAVFAEVTGSTGSPLNDRDISRSTDGVSYSPVTAADLWAGALPREHDALINLFRTLTYLRQYRKSHGVELGEALIAACALMSGAALWTRNRKHHPMKVLTFFLVGYDAPAGMAISLGICRGSNE
jgi:hypothetical protein